MPLPASSTIENFDGQNKVNNQGLPPANQSLDWNNPLLAAATSDVAALGQTGPRFWCRLTLAASTGSLVLLQWRSVWQNVTTTAPIPARTSTGLFTITLPNFVSDEYDASVGITNNISVNLGAGHGNIEGSGLGKEVNVSASGNVITIYTGLSGSAAANDLVGTTISVFVYAQN